MIDIKRKVPRFNLDFTLYSNNIKGVGVNISQRGLGFLTNEELVLADDIPYEADLKGYIFSNKTYFLKGKARLLFSVLTNKEGEVYYNGFEFISFEGESQEKLFELLEDIRKFKKNLNIDIDSKNISDYMYYPSSDPFAKANLFSNTLKKNFLQRYEMFSYYLDTTSSAVSNFKQIHTGDSKEMVMMGSNNYLGLSTHPDVINAGVEALKKYGTGNGAGAMVGGTMSIHKKLEDELAHFTGKEAALIFNSGYSTNLGAISGILRPHDAVINDQYNHASIYDGCALSGAKTLAFTHNNVDSLERVLKRAKLKYNGRLIVVDGVYSTDGSLAPLEDIVKLAKQYDCKIMVDEAHGLGVLGEKGVGASEYCKQINDIDIIMGTMSKSLAGVGGFIASKRDVVEYLRFYARSYLFSTNIPPASAATILKALEVMQKDKSIREQLHSNIEFFKKGLLQLDMNIGDPKAAVVPIIIPDMANLMKVSRHLYEKGIFHNVMSYPAVPMGGSLIRFGIMATHTENELQIVLDAVEDAVEKGFFSNVCES